MPNQIQGQVGFPAQAPATGVYRVGAGCLFTTIQAAIDQAVADGYTTGDNPALVEIAPGTYTENVQLKPGVNLNGISSGASGVYVVGNCTYPVSNGATRAQNSIAIQNMTLTCLNGITLDISGNAPIQLTLVGVSVQKQSGGDANPAYQHQNTGAGSRVRFNQGCTVDHGVTTAEACRLVRGTTEFRQRNTAILNNSGGTIVAGVVLQNSARLTVWGCDNWINGAYTDCIDIQGAGAIADLWHTWLQNTLAGGNGVNFTAAGTARVRYTVISMDTNVTGYVAKGAAGTFIDNVANTILTTNRQIQNTLTYTTQLTALLPTP